MAIVPKRSGFNTLAINVMFTLNLSDSQFFGLKDSVSDMDLGEGEHINLYSPFRKMKKKPVGLPVPDGILRTVLQPMFALTDALNSSKVVYAGSHDDVSLTLQTCVLDARNQIESLLPLAEDTVIAKQIMADENAAPVDIRFSDLVRVGYWVNEPTEVASGAAEVMLHSNAVLNFTLNSGALYDSASRGKYIQNVVSVLNMMATFRGEEASTNVLLGVNIDPRFLSNADFRELLSELLDVQGFVLYTRNELYAGNMEDWLPSSKAVIDSTLLSPGSDLLLVCVCNGQPEENTVD
jgi:hypothetical protein